MNKLRQGGKIIIQVKYNCKFFAGPASKDEYHITTAENN